MKTYTPGPSGKVAGPSRDLDPQELAAQRQFMERLEMAVAVANREVIHQLIPDLSAETFQQLAVMVARFRANYLAAAIKLSAAANADASSLDDLKLKRDLYEQGRAAFEALERAIERGYVDIRRADADRPSAQIL